MSHARILSAVVLPLLAGAVTACSPDSGKLEPAEATYDFGAVAMGRTTEQKVRVTNAGTLPLTLRTLTNVAGDTAAPEAVFELVFVPGTELPAGQSIDLTARFNPPVVDAGAEYRITLRLAAEDSASVEHTATITLVGRSVVRSCEVPAELDFGSVSIGGAAHLELALSNPTAFPVDVTVGEPYSPSGDAAAFTLSADSLRSATSIPAGSAGKVAIDFRPSALRDHQAFLTIRPAPECPEKTVTLAGTGVDTGLTWTPTMVDCGYVPTGMTVIRPVTFQNISATAIRLTQLKTLNTVEFSIVGVTELTIPAASKDASGTWLPGEAALDVTCRPATLGPRQTSLTFQTGLVKTPTGSISLKVFGGGPDIQVTPSPALDFGKVAYFSNGSSYQRKKLTVMNVGPTPSTPDPKANLRLGQAETGFGPPYVVVTPLNADTLPDEFTVTVPATYDPAVGLVAKVGVNTAELMVEVRPQSVGLKEAKIEIFSNDPDEPVVTVTASADSVVLPPCNYTVTPTTLNFGLIGLPDFRDLAFTIQNTGTNAGDICILSQLDLAPGSHPYFSLPSGVLEQRELPPGEEVEVKVRVWPQGTTPTGMTPLTGQVNFFMSSDVRPQAAVILNAQLGLPCLEVAPNSFDFGAVKLGCASATRTFRIYGTCSAPVTINSVALQCPNGACPEFTLSSAPALPAAAAVGGSPLTFDLRYQPSGTSPDANAVIISAVQSGANVTYVLPVFGHGDAQSLQSQTYAFPLHPKADVLFVIDDSAGMDDDQQALANNFASLIQYAQAERIDFHMAVVKTSPGTPDFAQLWSGPTHPETVLTPSTPNLAQKFADKVMVGGGGGAAEWDSEPALQALTAPLINQQNAGFLRPDASLAIVVLTDEPDQSPWAWSYYLDRFWNLKGHQRKELFTFSAISGFTSTCLGDDGGLAFYADATGGRKVDICRMDLWPSELGKLGKVAFGFQSRYVLDEVPDTRTSAIELKVDGVALPAVDARGATVWSYDPVTNAVTIGDMYAPEPDQTLTVTYPTACYP